MLPWISLCCRSHTPGPVRRILSTTGGIALCLSCGGETSPVEQITHEEHDNSNVGTVDAGEASESEETSDAGYSEAVTSGGATSSTLSSGSNAVASGDSSASTSHVSPSEGSSDGFSTAPDPAGTGSTGTSASTGNSDEGSSDAEVTVPIQWVPVDAPPFDLSDCREQRIPGEASCAYQLLCEGNTLSSNCARNEAGQWECSCQNFAINRSEQYQLFDIDDPMAACLAGLPHCVPDHEPAMDIECSLADSGLDGYSCSLSEVCVGNGELPGGIRTQQSEIMVTRSCSLGEYGFDCPCDRNDSTIVIAPEANDACVASHSVCAGTVELTGERYCEPRRASVEDDGCSIDWLCGNRTNLGNDVYVSTDNEFPSIWCGVFENDTYECFAPADSEVSGASVVADTPLAACETMQALSDEHPELQATGPIDCSLQTAYSYPEGGTIDAWCSQAVELGEVGTFTVSARLIVDCLLQEDDWECECYSHGSYLVFTTSGDGSQSVTAAALEQCVNRAKLTEQGQGVGYEFL